MTSPLVFEDGAASLAAARGAYADFLSRRLAGSARAVGPAASTVMVRLGQLRRTRPDSFVEIVTDPRVAVRIHHGPAALAIALVALELAARRALADPVEIEGVDEIWSATANVKIARAGGGAVAIEDGAVTIGRRRIDLAEPRGAGVSRPFVRVGEGYALGLSDGNPISHLEDHPEKHGNALSLGGRRVEEWTSAIERALAWIARHAPRVAEELAAMHRLFLPVGFEPERHYSASFTEYVGAMYLSLHPRDTTIAEAIVHEFQHSKINLLSFFDPILENATTERVRSPIRPDPRPIMGVLLAAHAFVPVAELYRRAGEHEARLADVVAKNQEALDVLDAHARPTELGRRVLERLRAMHAEHARLGLARPTGPVAHD